MVAGPPLTAGAVRSSRSPRVALRADRRCDTAPLSLRGCHGRPRPTSALEEVRTPKADDPLLPAPEARPFGPALAGTYGATVAVASLSLVNVLIMSRALGAAGRGDVVFLMTVAGLTALVASLSVQEANANLVGLEPPSRPALATNSLILALGLGVASAGLVYGLGELFPVLRGEAPSGLIPVALAAIPLIIFQNYLMLLVRSDYAAAIANIALLVPAFGNVVVNASLAVLGLISVATALVTWVATQLLATVLLAWYVHARLAGFGRPDRPLSRRAVGFGLKTHLNGVMTAGTYRLDQWFIGSIAGSSALGVYSVAVAWAEALYFLPRALALVFRPDIVRAGAEGARRRASQVLRLALVVTLPLVVAILLAAPFLCATLFGEQFAGATVQLRLLTLGAVGLVTFRILGNALVAQGRPLSETAGAAAGFVVTIALDILLIPPFGGVGASIASSLAYAVAGVTTGALFLRVLGGRGRDLLPRRTDVAAARDQLAALVRGAVARIAR